MHRRAFALVGAFVAGGTASAQTRPHTDFERDIGNTHAPAPAAAPSLASRTDMERDLSRDPATSVTASALERAFATASDQVRVSVVGIRRRDDLATGDVVGAGLVVRSDGYILTTTHVIEDATEVDVVFHNGTRWTGRVVGTDLESELALIRISAPPLDAAELPLSRQVRLGQWAVSVGVGPAGERALSAGIVSGTRAGAHGGELLASDAAGFAACAGGPLVDLEGNVLGIALGARDGRGPLAVSARTARFVSDRLAEYGAVRRVWIGAEYETLTARVADGLGFAGVEGAIVVSVARGGPADAAGLRPGDVITAALNRPVAGASELRAMVAGTQIGDAIDVWVARDPSVPRVRLAVVGAATPASELSTPPTDSGRLAAQRGLGLVVRPIRPEEGARRGTSNGAYVSVVTTDSPADRAGLRVGDVIVEADRAAVLGSTDIEAALRDGRAVLRIARLSGSTFTVLSAAD